MAMNRVDQLPIVVLNPVHQCNCRCLMCGYWKSSHVEILEFDTIERLISEWGVIGVRWAALSGGEPLVHPRFSDICRRISSENIRLSLLTNGLALAENASAVARFCTDIFLSLDGPPAIHDRIRNVYGAFDKLSGGVAALRRENPEIEITARCTVQQQNHAHLGETVKTAMEMGLDRISFIPVDTGSAFRRSGKHSYVDCGLKKEDIQRLAFQIDALEEEFEWAFDGFIADSKNQIRDRLLRYFKAELKLDRHRSNRCNGPWVSVVIDADGSVLPCFFHPPVGNIHENSLSGIVNSPKAVDFRKRLNVRENPVCQRCVCSLYYEPAEET